MTCTVKEYTYVPKQSSICWLQVPSWALQLSMVLSKLLMGLFGVVRAAGPPCCWFCCCCFCCTVSLSSFRSISAFTRSERTEQQVFDFCINSTWWHSQHDNDLMLIISLYDIITVFLCCWYWPRLRLRMPPVPVVLSCLGTSPGLKAFGLAATLPAGPIFPETGDAVYNTNLV